jgi:hypothetical protein
MELIIAPSGAICCIYGEELDLHVLGRLSIRRGSHVEPDRQGQWLADLAPVGGPVLGPFRLRSDALEAERTWLERHWLVPARSAPA